MAEQIEQGGQPSLRPRDRAIVLAVATVGVMYVSSLTYPDTSPDRIQSLDLVLSSIATLIIGLASGTSAVWRLLIGLFIVSPLEQVSDIALGRPNAWSGFKFAEIVMLNTALTLLLPYLDPPRRILSWATGSPSNAGRVWRQALLYLGYGSWLMLIFLIITFVSLSIVELTKIAAGHPDMDGQVFDQQTQIGVRVLLAIIGGVIIAVSAWVWIWRRSKLGTAFPEKPRETTTIPADIADAVRESADPPR